MYFLVFVVDVSFGVSAFVYIHVFSSFCSSRFAEFFAFHYLRSPACSKNDRTVQSRTYFQNRGKCRAPLSGLPSTSVRTRPNTCTALSFLLTCSCCFLLGFLFSLSLSPLFKFQEFKLIQSLKLAEPFHGFLDVVLLEWCTLFFHHLLRIPQILCNR